MNRLGIQSLNAGAPDLRLSGDQTQRGTYVQRRRNQMAYGGIAGLDGRRRYGFGSWFQEKIKDPIKEKFVDPAIDFVTDNPLLSAAGVGLGINQFGLPGGAGQNWIGELLGNVTPGGTIDLVAGKGGTGQTLGNVFSSVFPGKQIPGWSGMINPMGQADTGGMDEAGLPANWREMLAERAMNDPSFKGLGADAIGQLQRIMSGDQYGGPITGGIANQFTQWMGGQQQDIQRQKQLEQQRALQNINWELPLAGGLAAGAYQKKYLEDQPEFGEDTTGINFQTAKQVMADPKQRFKPQEQYVLPSALAAEGGRIGYNRGRVVNPGGYAGTIDRNIANLQAALKYSDLTPEQRAQIEADLKMSIEAKGGIRDKLLSGDPVKEDIIDTAKEATDFIEEEGEEEGFWDFLPFVGKAQGGRIGYAEGKNNKGIMAAAKKFFKALGWEGTGEEARKGKQMMKHAFGFLPTFTYPEHIYGGDRERLSRYRKEMDEPDTGSFLKDLTLSMAKPSPQGEERWKRYKRWMAMENLERANQASGGRIGYADAGEVRKDPYDVIEGMDNELNPGIIDRLPFFGAGKYPLDEYQGASLIDEIQDYKYGISYPGETIRVNKENVQGGMEVPKPDRAPMSMEETIKALEDRWDEAIEEGHRPGHGGEFDDLGIYEKEDIRRRVELGFKQAKGPTTGTGIATVAQGGRIGAQEGGLMNLGGMEKDYRQEGGFVPIGGQEKADDVPARLSKNEFVFTADAVRAAGGGDIDAGAEVMENVMENLEAGGKVSEESQGLEGARDMFANAQQLEKRII